jgi:magnesium transporter
MSLDKLTFYYLKQYPDEAAITLNQSAAEDINKILSEISPAERGAIIAHLVNEIVGDYIKGLSTADIEAIFSSVPLKTAVRLTLKLDDETEEKVLSALPIDLRAKINALTHFGSDSVASKVDTDVCAFDSDLTVKAAIESIKRYEAKLLHIIYVVDKNFKLIGFVDLRKLLIAERDKTLADIMSHDIVYLPASTRLAKADMNPAWERVNHLPVVNQSGQFIGVLSQRQLPKTALAQQSTLNILADNFIIFIASFVGAVASSIEFYFSRKQVRHGTEHR